MTPERFARLQKVLDQRQPDLTVITDRVNKAQNQSAILRTCDAVGIHQMHRVKPDHGKKIFHRTAGGSSRYVGLKHHDTIEDGITVLKEQGFTLYAAHLSDQAVDYMDVDYSGKCAIVLGAEKFGISDYAAANVDKHITIPMAGMVESLNVSVAGALILQQAYRQRKALGYYDQCRLPLDEYNRTIFRWAHPRLADFCHKRQLEYPDIDDQGYLIDGKKWYDEAKSHLQINDEKLLTKLT